MHGDRKMPTQTLSAQKAGGIQYLFQQYSDSQKQFRFDHNRESLLRLRLLSISL